jgi:hypothetical protein
VENHNQSIIAAHVTGTYVGLCRYVESRCACIKPRPCWGFTFGWAVRGAAFFLACPMSVPSP